MKKIFSLILAMFLAFGTYAYADNSLAEYAPGLIYNNEEKQIDDIKNVDGRVILPFRAIFEMMGATVDYEQSISKVTAVRDDKTIEFYVNGDRIFVTENGETSEIPAEIGFDYEKNRVMVPVRFISNALGARVGWNSEQRCVYVLDTYPMIKNLIDECPDFFDFAESTANLDKNIKSDNSLSVAFSGLFDNTKVQVNVDADTTESYYENSGTGSLNLDFTHKNLDDVTGYNIGQLKGLTFDVLKTEDCIYLNTNLTSKLSSLLPDEEKLKALDNLVSKDTWIKVDYDYIEENFDTKVADMIFKGTSLENYVDNLISSLSLITYSDMDVTAEEMYSVKQFFDTYKNVLKKSVFKQTGKNSFTFKFNIDTEGFIGLIYPELITEEDLKEMKSVMDIDISYDISVKNGIIEKENSSFDMKLKDKDSGIDMLFTINGNGKSKKLTSQPKIKIPENSIGLDAILMLFE